MRQAEMEAHDSRARLLHDNAHGVVERRPRRPHSNTGRVNSGLCSKARAARARAPRLPIGRGLGMAKEIHVEGSLRLSSDGGDLFAQEIWREHCARQGAESRRLGRQRLRGRVLGPPPLVPELRGIFHEVPGSRNRSIARRGTSQKPPNSLEGRLVIHFCREVSRDAESLFARSA